MKVETIQIVWHMREPVLSCDFSPADATRFATAGQDKSVKLWRLSDNNNNSSNNNESSSSSAAAGASRVTFLASLERHGGPVNVVRFSPDGSKLASASDDGYVIVWQKADESQGVSVTAANNNGSDAIGGGDAAAGGAADAAAGKSEFEGVESWSVLTLMRATQSVYDLAWSPSADCIVVGCIDHKAIIWELASGNELLTTRDHEHYVQGVAWDPASRFVATHSADRSLLLYDAHSALAAAKEPPTGSVTKAQVKKFTFPLVRKLHDWHGETFNAPLATAAEQAAATAATAAQPDAAVLAEKKRRLFLAEHDNISFFRRLQFTPDGSLLLVPAGVAPRASTGKAAAAAAAAEGEAGDAAPMYCVQVFKTAAPRNPVAHFPFPNHPPVCVRVCPALFALRATAPGTPPSVFELPYRMLFAVAALDEVVVYDTQQQVPIAVLRGLHYSSIHDLAWSADGRALLFASADGYCSVATLSDAERGELLPADALEPAVAQRLAHAKVSAVAQRKRWREERKAFLAAKRAAKQAAGEEVGADDEDDEESDAAKTAANGAAAAAAAAAASSSSTAATAVAATSDGAEQAATTADASAATSDAVVQPQKRRVVLFDAY